MARAIKQGQHIFIAFQDGEAVLDSQLRPRMYKSREQFEKSFPAWRDGKAELAEYAPTLTPPNEALTLEQLREMDGEAVYWPKNKMWLIVYLNHPDFGDCAVNRDGQYLKLENCEKRKVYRRPPEGEA